MLKVPLFRVATVMESVSQGGNFILQNEVDRILTNFSF